MAQAGYIVGFGSNLAPAANAGRVLEALARRFGRVCVSSAYVTVPVGMSADKNFLNLALFLPTDWNAEQLKAYCCRLETQLGRDRTRPDRKWRDRTADLDLLSERLEPAELNPRQPDRICDASYMQGALEQLLTALGGGRAVASAGREIAEVEIGPQLVLQNEALWLACGTDGVLRARAAPFMPSEARE